MSQSCACPCCTSRSRAARNFTQRQDAELTALRQRLAEVEGARDEWKAIGQAVVDLFDPLKAKDAYPGFVMLVAQCAKDAHATVREDRDEARQQLAAAQAEIAGLQGANAGLSVSDGFFQRRCELLEAAAVRNLTPAESDSFKGCCPLCALTVVDHCAETERMTAMRTERTTAEAIASWLEDEAASCGGGRSTTGKAAARAFLQAAADIRNHAWKVKS